MKLKQLSREDAVHAAYVLGALALAGYIALQLALAYLTGELHAEGE